MKQKLLNTVERLRKKGDYEYILSQYVEQSFWIKKLQNLLPTLKIEDLTDFNYSTCFTMYVNISDTDSHVGTEKFRQFIIRNLCLYRIQIQVSAIAPYAVIKYIKYSYKNNVIGMEDSFVPFLSKHSDLGKKIENFLKELGIETLDEEILTLNIEDIKLELKESDVTIYNCLFEDEC